MVGAQQVMRLSQDCNMSSVSTVDRLSTLPDNVIEAILVRLPIKYAVRTSILSHRWRYEWNNISQLVFDRRHFSKRQDQEQTEFDSKLVKIVDRVLLLHHGPVLGFKLSTHLENCADVGRWILFLSRNGIKSLTLLKLKGGWEKLHPCLFSCSELTFLKLYGWRLDLPVSFKGFRNLTVLTIHSVGFSKNGLEVLISLCPLLKDIAATNLSGCPRLKICAPQLICLLIECTCEELSLESTPLLASAFIKLLSRPEQSVASGTKCKLIDMFCLPNIEKLELLRRTLQNSMHGDLPMKLPIIPKLKYLTVDLNFEDKQVIIAVRCFLRSSPAMQKLIIKACSDKKEARIPVGVFWEAQKDDKCLISSSLKIIKVEQFSGIESEMKFVGFLLANAPVLETLQIEPGYVRDIVGMLKKLVRLRRRSPEAEIII